MLSGKYSSYSFSYQSVDSSFIGILWHEEPNLTKFSNVMKACTKAIESSQNLSLILIRSEFMGTKKNKGYQIYQQIFNNSSHRHLESSLESVHYLKTYQKLVNDAISGDLVLNFEPLTLTDLEGLVRQTKILHPCSLLQDLKIVPVHPINKPGVGKPKEPPILIDVKEFLLNLVKHHHLLGQQILIQQVKSQFTEIVEATIENLIQELAKEQKISIVNPNAKPKERLICLIPQAAAGASK